jgi:phosphate starvation-inducible protein PhoH
MGKKKESVSAPKKISSKNADNFRIELTPIQKTACNFLREDQISIFTGSAGTGKDVIQMHRALTGLIAKEFDQIIIIKPTVEVGVKLGYLPGEISSKTEPYERSFYESISKMLNKGVFDRIKNKIKFEPIAYARGLTFSHSCCILSEGQNCSLHELMTIATRIDTNSKLMINADRYQQDIRNSGINNFINIMEPIEGVGHMYLGDEYQMRNPMIVEMNRRYVDFIQGKK